MSLYEQLLAFGVTIVIGIGAAFLYDFYRVIQITARLKKWRLHIGDLLFWIALTVLVFGALLLGNMGEVRWYVFLGIIVGTLFYQKLLARAGFIFWQKCFRFGGWVLRATLAPFAFTWQVLTWPFRFSGKVTRILKRRFASKRSGHTPDGEGIE
ncbi:MAG: hypothetical protein H0Z39_01040 [Peptococcaceae bacterium]|nr:hypothetical protein [Peptococcaceae bacterium]